MVHEVVQPPPSEVTEALASAHRRLPPALALQWYAEIASTNTAAVARADAGAEEGMVVAAEMQREGRGRLGRTWYSPPGSGLYFSIVLRPDDVSARLLTVAAGVGVAEGIERATGLALDLKWPNDLYADGRKAGGILTEGGVSRDGRAFAVVGVGVNVGATAFPREIASRATALELELGRPLDRGLVLTECLVGVFARYGQLRDGDRAGVVGAWRARASFIVGRPIEWDVDGGTASGVVESVDDDAALVVRSDAGRVRLISGEVRWT